MSDSPASRRSGARFDEGHTLLELMIVVTIAGILATLAEPLWQESVTKAREASLKQTLFNLRDVLDQYRADRGRYPQAMVEVVSAGYLRQIPLDPFTRSTTTWQEIPSESEGGIFDVHSGSPLIGTDKTPYNQW
ncbi:MAG: prepilin-type N-terminal cleavage/methylation domain-containing protein [Nitrospirae bacterium]|nr:prepilin-type N-terminal cleavage/methylation domain-containing protein [Nitrospirota bacterium]